MKILYSAGDRFGANYQLSEFLKHSNYRIKIAAYPRAENTIPFFHWNLASIENSRDQLFDDISKYDPDCVVIDYEPVVAAMAHNLSLPILYCSSLHAFDAIFWQKKQQSYYQVVNPLRQKLNELPTGISKLIYSPLSMIVNKPLIREGYDWIQPYHSNELNLPFIENHERNELINKSYQKKDIIITSGETFHIERLISAGKQFLIAPSVEDSEEIVNSIVCSQFGIAPDIGQIELMGRYGFEYIDKIIESFQPSYELDSNVQFLHERIDTLWECM